MANTLHITGAQPTGKCVSFDGDYNVLDSKGHPKPHTAEQKVEILRLLLKYQMAYANYVHWQQWSDLYDDDNARLKQCEAKYLAISKQFFDLIGQYDADV